MNRTNCLLVAASLFLAVGIHAQIPHAPNVKIGWNIDGSEPPDYRWLDCVDQLADKPYDQVAVNQCLKRILATPYFESGKISVEPPSEDTVRVTFALHAPALHITDLTIHADPSYRPKLLSWLGNHPDALQPNDTYTYPRQVRTWGQIVNFYASQGKRVGVQSQVWLNYAERTARLMFKVYLGPDGVIDPVVIPPTGLDCPETLTTLNLTDIDDYVPLPLVDSLMRIRFPSCFRAELLTADAATLNQTGLFALVKFTVLGPPDSREIDLTIRGKPIVVREVSITKYGAAVGMPVQVPTQLPVREREIYSRSKAYESKEMLESYFRRPNLRVEVFEDDALTPERELKLTLSVLAYEQDEIYVNGERMKAMTK